MAPSTEPRLGAYDLPRRLCDSIQADAALPSPSLAAHRFPHALVMTFLFGRGTPSEKLQFIFKATRMHSFNLMKFASLYKFLQIVLRRTNGGKARSLDSFIAGIVGGWVVFGERTAVNEQVSWRC